MPAYVCVCVCVCVCACVAGNKREIDRLDPGCPERALGQLVPRYGDVFRVNLANFCLAAVLSPADALHVTRTLDLPKPRFVYETLPFHGLVGITNVKEHRFRRALLAPTFKSSTVTIAAVTRAMLGKVVQRLRGAAQRQAATPAGAHVPPADIKELMVALTMDVMAHWAFHIDLSMIDKTGTHANPLAAAMVEVFDFTQRVVRAPAGALNPMAQLRRIRAQRVITSTVMSIVRHRRTIAAYSPPDVIDRLLHEQKTRALADEYRARGETPFEIHDRHIVDEVITILQAGSETTSSTYVGRVRVRVRRRVCVRVRARALTGGARAFVCAYVCAQPRDDVPRARAQPRVAGSCGGRDQRRAGRPERSGARGL
jgi:cytochrome P450